MSIPRKVRRGRWHMPGPGVETGGVWGTSDPRPPRPFRTDGCSMWPDRVGGASYGQCCVEHDRAYWRGGPPLARWSADIKLQDCVTDTLVDRGWPYVLASWFGYIMYLGVRVGGHPSLPFPWRWGYGYSWKKARGYRLWPSVQKWFRNGRLSEVANLDHWSKFYEHKSFLGIKYIKKKKVWYVHGGPRPKGES